MLAYIKKQATGAVSLTLSWIGSVYGQKTIPLGIDRFGQTGNIKDLFTEFRIDTSNICNLGFNYS